MVVLITGGASGLGGAITQMFAALPGCSVYFTFSKSEESANSITAEFANTTAIKCDFSNADEVAILTEKISAIDPDILINNAYTGEAIKTHFHKIPKTDFLKDFEHNIIPIVAITQAAITAFRKKRSGKIITILTSFLVDVPPTGSAIYVANKAYLKQLTKVWAAENAKFDITSNSVSPSFMLTNFTKETDERILEQMTAEHPLKKILTVGDVVQTVAYLANASPHINGIDIVLNAAQHIN
jgi:3-oxoacyl-[acyl-carrier protein] reductase